jgi:hypothetical protein
MDNGKARSLSDYSINRTLTTWNNRNRQVVANIAGYYGNQVGVNDVGATYKEEGMAHYNSGNNGIWIAPNDDGKVSSLLNDKNNLMNTLIHEQQHRTNNGKGVKSTFESHVGVYINQMSEESFSKTTEDFQNNTIKAMTSYLAAVKSGSKRQNLVNQFNDNNVGGYKLSNYKSGYGWGLEKNGKKEFFSVKKQMKPN